MSKSRPSMSSQFKTSVSPVLKKVRRVGWVAEDGVDAGVKLAKKHPRKTGTVVLGVVILTASFIWICRRPKQ